MTQYWQYQAWRCPRCKFEVRGTDAAIAKDWPRCGMCGWGTFMHLMVDCGSYRLKITRERWR